MTFLPLFRSRNILLRCQICFYLLLSLLSGALLPIQASVNAQLAQSLQSAPLAADLSYLIGLLALVALLLTGQFGHLDWHTLGQAPRWSFMGGIFGAWYIASSAYFVSILGATLTLGFVVGGQAIAGIITDHFGWLGMPQHRLTRHRRIAVGLLAVALFFLTQ
jgi:transporter family-2 protein